MSLPVAHLSDEAVAAYADGALSAGARARAARHLADCAECAQAVVVQREAVWALRAAPAPSLPCGLLDRLRAVPITTPLHERALALDEDGSAVFPAFGTAALQPPEPPPADPAQSHSMSRVRRPRSYGLFTAAAAVVALGTAGIAISAGDHTGARPGAPAEPAVPAVPAGQHAVLDPAGQQLFLRPALGAARVLHRH